MPVQLTQVEIANSLEDVPKWFLDGKNIRRTFELKDFTTALGFVTSVGALAEQEDHHPDIDIRYNRVTLTLSTHSAGGLTRKDFELARAIDAL